MKKKKNLQSMGDAIKHMIKELGWEEKMLEVQSEKLFREMMGDYILKYVTEVFIKNRVLFVRMDSPALKNELSYGKSKIKDHINEGLEKKFIKDVKFL